MNKELIKKLPKGYVSWSQLNLWERDPRMYQKVYFDNLGVYSEAMDFGKRVAVSIENGDNSGDPSIEFIKMLFPKCPQREREYKINAVFEGIPLKGVMDRFSNKLTLVQEYKTGKTKWTQKMVDTHGQLTIYGMLVWKKYGYIPKFELIWAPTIATDDGIVSAGNVVRFETERTKADFAKMYGRLKRFVEGVAKLNDSIKK